jgi:hypothetical protein
MGTGRDDIFWRESYARTVEKNYSPNRNGERALAKDEKKSLV